MRYLFTALCCLSLSTSLLAQEEFLLGKSANTLALGGTVISAEYNVFAFENIRSKRAGIDIAYGLTDRLTMSLRGSLSDFSTSDFALETGSLTAIYQLGRESDLPKKWAFAPFIQASIIGRTGLVPADVNLDTHNSGFSGGFIVNRNFEGLILSGSVAYAKVTFPRLVDGILDGAAYIFQLSANKSLNMAFEKNSYQLSLLGELMGQTNDTIGKNGLPIFDGGQYLDVLGGLQVTANNRYRVELAVQTEIFGNLSRFSEGLYHIRLKYLVL